MKTTTFKDILKVVQNIRDSYLTDCDLGRKKRYSRLTMPTGFPVECLRKSQEGEDIFKNIPYQTQTGTEFFDLAQVLEVCFIAHLAQKNEIFFVTNSQEYPGKIWLYQLKNNTAHKKIELQVDELQASDKSVMTWNRSYNYADFNLHCLLIPGSSEIERLLK